MRLTVRHETTYRFDPPRGRVVQSHRLTPAATEGQRIIGWKVGSPGAAFGAGFVDGAGNIVDTMTMRGPVAELTVSVEGTVETTDTAGVLRGLREAVPPEVYLRRTRLTAPDKTLADLAARARGESVLDRAHALATLVSDAITYTPGATHSEFTAAEALALGHGVCQDQTQVLITAARTAGIPARYVQGYLFSDAEGEAVEASHAWAELHVAGLGWVGFDPANRCCPDARYIRVGSGLDALDAAPIRGISLGPGAESMDIEVSVSAQQ